MKRRDSALTSSIEARQGTAAGGATAHPPASPAASSVVKGLARLFKRQHKTARIWNAL